MSSSLQHRLERAQRAIEWVQAQAGAERLLRWAAATDQLTPSEVTTLRDELRAVAPFARYVNGRWQPPADLVPNRAAEDAMLAAVDAWEVEQGILS